MPRAVKKVFFLTSVFILALFFSGCATFRVFPARSVASFDKTPIVYSVKGKGKGKTVLCFVHGWSCHSGYWRYQVKKFQKNFTVVTIDLAGHGRSGSMREKYTMSAFGKDIASVLERINAEQVILVGHSMGGTVALEAARRMPERVIGIIGVDTFHNIEARYTDEEFRYLFDYLKSNYVEGTRSLVYGMFTPSSDKALVQEIIRDMSGSIPRVGISAIEELFSTNKVQLAKKVSVPVVCVNADLWPSAFEINKKWLPGYRLYLLAGLSHFPMLEEPDMFNAELERAINYIQAYETDEKNN
jgi:pimeloyl-ACP methyl ester carboxylesterase